LKPVFIIVIIFSITISLVGVVAMTNTVDDTSAAEAKVGVVAMTNTVDDTSAAEAKVAENVVNTVSLQDRQDASEAARAEAWEKHLRDNPVRAEVETDSSDVILDKYGSYSEYFKQERMNKILDRYGSYSEYLKQERMDLMGDCDNWDNEGYYVGEGAMYREYNKCQP
jgi:hypothetical protein